MSDKLCLLIVDDDADLLDPLIEVCGRFNFKVIGATSGAKALDLLAQCHVDAVLTDVRMQPMSGFVLLDAVRGRFPSMPFILWTGFWDRPDEKRAAKIANVERLEKPFTFKELETVLNRIRAKVLGATGDGDNDGDREAASSSGGGGSSGVYDRA